MVRRRGTTHTAHRAVYLELHAGETPPDVVRHTCDNPECVNPGHLIAGTHRDNTDDKVERERQARGEDAHKAKLTEATVTDIRRRAIAGERYQDIADEYGVSNAVIHKAATGRTWTHVPGPVATGRRSRFASHIRE